MKKNILKNEAFIAGGIACLGCIIMLAACRLLPGQDYVLINDSSNEVIPFIRMFYRHLFKGESLYYSWDIGLGVSTSVTYAFYVFSPVNLLVLLFKNNATALIVLMISKTALSAFFMSVFLKKCVRLNSGWNIALSILYAFSNYQLMMFKNICLGDVVWLLPLLITCIYLFVKGKLTSFQLSVCYALCFVTQFYAGFLTGIYSMFFLIGMVILKRADISSDKLKKILFKWIWAVFSAVCVSMLLLWPLLVAYFSKGGSDWNGFASDRKIDLLAFVSAFFWGRGDIWYEETPALYCGIATLLILPSYFADRSVRKIEKYLITLALVAFTVSFFAEPIYEFWHLFNRPDGFTSRFSILFVFTCVMTAGRGKALSDRFEEQSSDDRFRGGQRVYEVTAVIMLLITGGIYVYWYFTDQTSFAHPLRLLSGNIVLIIAWTLAVIKLRNRNNYVGKYLVVLVAFAEAVTAGFLPVNECGKDSSDNAIVAADTMRAVSDVISRDRGEFYRTNISGAEVNQGAVYGFNGVSLFSSENYENLLFTMFRLGDSVTPFSCAQSGATDFTDMIFGVKYRGNVGSDIYINDRALPIGFAVTDDIFDIKCENAGIDPFEVQNLIAAAFGGGTEVYIPLKHISYETYNMSFDINDDGSGIMTNLAEGEPGGIIINSEDKGYKHSYAFISTVSFREEDTGEIGDNPPGVDIVLYSDQDRCGDGTRSLAADPAVIEMESMGDGHRLRIIDLDKSELGYNFEKLCLYGQDEEALDQIYNELNSDKYVLDDMKPGLLRGTIDIPPEKKVLFLSIPYDRGWNAFIDGERAEIKPALMDSFCALSVPEGRHEIVLKYEMPGAWLKWVFFMMGIALWAYWILKGDKYYENR